MYHSIYSIIDINYYICLINDVKIKEMPFVTAIHIEAAILDFATLHKFQAKFHKLV